MKTNQQHYKRGTVTLAAHYRLVEGAIWAKRCLPRVAMTLLALFSFIGARAQQTLTVCDGTDYNFDVPFWGFYANAQGTASECVIPSHLLGEMAGGTITAMTFYLQEPAAEAWTGTHQVYIGEVDATTLTGITGPNLFTVVKTASFDATGTELTVVFDEPYTYEGGNLLIGTYVSVAGNYKRASFYGVSQTENTGWYRGTSAHSGYGVQFIPKTTFTYEPSTPCEKPSTFVVTDITTSGASFVWKLTEAGSYRFEYKKASDTEWTQIIIDEQGGAGNESFVYTLSGLDPDTDYYARVKAICGEGSESNYKSLSFTTTEPLCIGTGTATNGYLPAQSSYDYTLTEQIYTADEIGQAGTILSLDFFNARDINMATDLDIYIVSTDKTAFESTAERITVTASDLVYSGTVTFADNDWTTIELDEPFVYDGNRNICIVVDDNTGSYKNDTPFRVFDASGYQSICYLSDDTNLDPTGAISLSGTRLTQKNCIRLGIGEPPACPKPTGLAASNITAHTATLTWTAPATEKPVTRYVYQYKKANGMEWSTGASVTTTSVTLSGLNGQTTYDFHVMAVYANGASTFISTSFTTECDTYLQVPYAFGFEDATVLNCWTVITDRPNDTRIIHLTNYAYTGSKFFEFDGSANPQYLISPQLSGIGNSLHVEFYYRRGNSSNVETFHVGYSTTDNNPESFVWGDEINDATTTYQLFSADYPADTKYVAIKHTSEKQSLEIDDFLFESVTPCVQPTDLATTYVGDRTATLGWTGYSDSYHVEYRKPEPASVLLSEDFEYASDFEARWNVVNNSVNYSERNDGKIERRYREPRHGGDYSFCFSSCSYGDSFEEYIISKDALTGVTNETVMEFYYSWTDYGDYIQVGYSSTTNDIASFTFGEPFSSSGGWGQFHEAVPVGTKYVAIKYTAAERYRSNIYIDDIVIGNPADWQTADTNEATVTLTGLEPATTYDVRVQGDCGNGDVSPVSETITFTTLEYLPGDVNSDGGVTIADVLAVVEYILNDGYITGIFNYQAANVDTSDYNITIADAVKILEIILKGGSQHE